MQRLASNQKRFGRRVKELILSFIKLQVVTKLNNMKKLVVASLLILIISCKETAKEKVSFKSYDDAINYTQSHSYKVNETTDTSESEWITSAEYKSVNGDNSFLILGMQGKEYIFDEVSLTVWESFKGAEDKGKYYHKFIKGKYYMNLQDYHNRN